MKSGGGIENRDHEIDGGAAAGMRTALVDADADPLGQLPHSATVYVLHDKHKRLVPDREVAEKIARLDHGAALGVPREEIAKEGAASAEQAAVHRELARVARDGGVGVAGEVRRLEDGAEVVREALESLHVGINRGGGGGGRGGGVNEADAAAGVVGVRGDVAALHEVFGAARRVRFWSGGGIAELEGREGEGERKCERPMGDDLELGERREREGESKERRLYFVFFSYYLIVIAS